MVDTSIVVIELRKRIAELESDRDRQQLLRLQEYLEVENERLLQRIEGLQRIIDADPVPQTLFTAQELSIYRALRRNRVATTTQLAAALHVSSVWRQPGPSGDVKKHIQVVILKLRRKGVEILNLHGVGYQMIKGVP